MCECWDRQVLPLLWGEGDLEQWLWGVVDGHLTFKKTAKRFSHIGSHNLTSCVCDSLLGVYVQQG